LSHDVFTERSGTVIAVALTSQEPRAGFPLALESNAPGVAEAILDQDQPSPDALRGRIGRRLARASEEEVDRIVAGLNEIIG
jgi:mRNA interferase MazF